MELPKNHIWGPHLWMILHSTSERIGSKKHLPSEETRLWSGLLSSLRYSIPCPQCKKHYSEYYASNPITDIRIWLYNLHSDINNRLNKENLSIDQLSELYSKPFHFSRHSSFIIAQMKCAIRIGWSTHNDINRTVRFLHEIKCFYDFF